MQTKCEEFFTQVPDQFIKPERGLFYTLFISRNKQLVHLWDLFVMSTHVNSSIKDPFKNTTQP